MRLLLLQCQTVEQPLQLPPGDGECLLLRAIGPAEVSFLQSSIVEPEAVVIPVKDLEFVAISVAEDEEAIGEQILLEDLADDCSQAIDGFAQIGASTGEIDRDTFCGVQHESAFTTARSIAGSKSGLSSIAAPAMRTVTPPGAV